MNDGRIEVEIALLRRHPSLPDPSDVLKRFAEHHQQSEARQKSHDELMESDSELELEDFGALAASALGTQSAKDSVLGEDPFFGNADDVDPGDTLPDQRAATLDEDDGTSSKSESVEAGSTTDEGESVDDTAEGIDAKASSNQEDTDSVDETSVAEPGSEQVEAMETGEEESSQDVSAAVEEPAAKPKKSSSKKRTRKRKKKS